MVEAPGQGDPAPGLDAGTARTFLPAALEVMESPPSPAGRRLVIIITLVFSALIVWSTVGRVDVVASAPGKVVPSGQVKVVQAPVAGAVAAIHVGEGERVARGDILLSLDATAADAERRRLAERLRELDLHLAWRCSLDAWLGQRDRSTEPGCPGPREGGGASGRAVGRGAAALLARHREEITAQLSRLAMEASSARAARDANSAERTRVEATLAVLSQRVDAYRTLLERNHGARSDYLALRQQQVDLQRSLPVLSARQQQLEDSAAALSGQVVATRRAYRRDNLLEISRLRSERAGLAQEHRKAQRHHALQTLRAPVAGAVQDLVVHTLGAVVEPAQALLRIVPEGAQPQVEALLQNKDIGFVHIGQSAEVKVDTFNFTRYGLIQARVAHVGRDAVRGENGEGWVFKVRLEPLGDGLLVGGRVVPLSPGMSVTAEIKTGERRLLEFFLSPLLRSARDSVRER